MTHDAIVVLAVLGVVGPVLVAAAILAGAAAAAGVRAPLRTLRALVSG
jgi:hypothetical protein